MSELPKSKMQIIADRVIEHNKRADYTNAISALLEAVALLSKAQCQVMGDITRLRVDSGRIGGDIRVGSVSDLGK